MLGVGHGCRKSELCRRLPSFHIIFRAPPSPSRDTTATSRPRGPHVMFRLPLSGSLPVQYRCLAMLAPPSRSDKNKIRPFPTVATLGQKWKLGNFFECDLFERLDQAIDYF